jgi:peroxiredoxin
MLKTGDVAPDFAIGGGTLYGLLDQGAAAVVFFFPRAYTPG